MRIKKYNIDAVHPTLKRVIESNLSKQDLAYLINDLLYNGYDQDDMEIETIEVPLIETDNNMLNDDELILKSMMIEHSLTEEKAKEYLKVVYEAMHKVGIIFYRP